MTNIPIVPWFTRLNQLGPQCFRTTARSKPPEIPRDLHHLASANGSLPSFVRESPVVMHYLHLLGPLAWHEFPERDPRRDWGIPAVPYAPFAAACLVKLDQRIIHMSHLRQYLLEHPPLVWALGFPLVISKNSPWGFDVEASLPTYRHFTHMLRHLPNSCLQFLLDHTVRLLRAELASEVNDFGQVISLDTKHILAWVKENNPKLYIKDRYDKTKQPAGDPDCRLGCKGKRNRPPMSGTPPTPNTYPKPARSTEVGEFYWGYGSGIVVTKVFDWCEIVLAELTQPFDHSDVSYFFPLMAATERRLGFRPRFGALDAAYDAFYTYEYFYRQGEALEAGFAAIPFSERGGYKRILSDDGLPVCQAGLPMPLKYTYTCKTTLIEHERGRHVCPLLYPDNTGQTCPVDHKQWPKGGCTSTMPTSPGARVRYQLDRDCELYKQIYNQRTATERVNALAVELGIERPKIRNGPAIANQNTLIYVLINLRALRRIRQLKLERDSHTR
jgi:hypothetical protein